MMTARLDRGATSAGRSAPSPAADAATARVAGCTCTRIRRLARRVTQHYDRALAPSGLRVTQYALLATLRRRASMAIGPLADALDMDRTTLTRNLKPLVDAKLVALAPNRDDARVREVRLTASGRRRHDEAKRLWRHAQDEVNRTWGDAQVASLHALVDGLIDRINHRTDRPGEGA